MKFVQVMYFGDEQDYLNFKLHVDNLHLKLNDYLNKNGHELDKLYIFGNEFGYCEEILYNLFTKGKFNNYDYVIFNHCDVFIKKFNFLDHIKNEAYGRSFFLVISINQLAELCKIKPRYYSLKDTKLGKEWVDEERSQSIFHTKHVSKKEVKIVCNNEISFFRIKPFSL